MPTSQAIVSWSSGRETRPWFPTTLDRLGKDEKFLEQILAATPELMGLETRRSGVRGPFKVFRQLDLETPSGRMTHPDIVLLAASGNVVVVEVKRYVNRDLRDRAVIAQIVDYASSFAALAEEKLTAMFEEVTQFETWPDLVQSFFPTESNPEELADLLLSRMQNGELNLVIACDKTPVGLPDVISGIASQATLGFDLDLVEITPYVTEETPAADIMFVPSTRLQTEIVSRTAVTVTYRQGDERPSTRVQTTSVEEIKDRVARGGTSRPRLRPERREFWQAFRGYLEEHAPDARPARVTDSASLDVSMERTGLTLKAFMYGDPTEAMGVRFKDREGLLDSLPPDTIQTIERALGTTFGRGKKKASSVGVQGIQLERKADISDPEQWPKQHKWLLDAMRKLEDALSPHIGSK